MNLSPLTDDSATLTRSAGRSAPIHCPRTMNHESPSTETGFIRRFQRAGGGRVLIMDDDELIRVMVAEVLKRAGLEVTATADGQEAMRRFCAARDTGRPFDLVILDLVIRDGQGGEETLRQMRALDTQTKIVVSSGYRNLPLVVDYAAHGFDQSLPKPYAAVDLLRLVADLLPGTTTA
jgi:CheY-like chemotaxis protein